MEYAAANGFVDRSLREIAAGVGTSHRMLVYHFGSREGLVAAVVGEVERRERERSVADVSGLDPTAALERIWANVAAPDRAGEERLFFELTVLALHERPEAAEWPGSYVEPWLLVAEQLAAAAGLPAGDARGITRLDLATVRGLLLDLLVTGDRQEVDEAFTRYLAWRRAGLRQPAD